jgi:hypothetical protein
MNEQIKRLAQAILADQNREKPERTDVASCFKCGRGMMHRGSRFCSEKCRDFYDLGEAGHEQTWLRPQIVYRDRAGNPMQRTTAGFVIACGNCHEQFESRGLRCCSTECERRYREWQENLRLIAEAGAEPSAKRKCERCGCPHTIPKWRNGRRGLASDPILL